MPRGAGRKGLTNGLRPTSEQQDTPCEPGPARHPGPGDHSVEERAPSPLRRQPSSAHWSWTLALLALRDRCCKRRETISIRGRSDRQTGLQQDPHINDHASTALWFAYCRQMSCPSESNTAGGGGRQGTNKDDRPLVRPSSPRPSPAWPTLVTQGSVGRCGWDTLSLCPSP